jgi:hypothetical protein
MLAKHALSQLSYGPSLEVTRDASIMVGLGGLEPPTSRLSSARSNQLSYKPELSAPGAARATAHWPVLHGRKRNEDGGVPQRRPDWPFDSKNSDKEAEASNKGISLERR